MKQPLVSIIIPTYNRPELLKERALKSAIAQTYANKQIIVVDDGSTVEYDISLPAYYYKPWEQNRGGSAARNYGITQARGDYVVFIDDDNELDPKFLSTVVPLMEDNDGLDAIQTGRIIKTSTDSTTAYPEQTAFPAIDWGWIIRRQVFYTIQYDESIWGDEDADFGIQFNKHFKYGTYGGPLQTAYVPDPGDEESSNTYPNKRRLRGLRNFLDKNLHEYTDPNERRYILRLAGRNFMKGGQYWTGLGYFWQMLQTMPNWRTFKHFFFACLGWSVYDWYMTKEEKRIAVSNNSSVQSS